MSAITTHILDTSRGRPAQGVAVVLTCQNDQGWVELGRGTTDQDGRIGTLMDNDTALEPGIYRLRFHTQAYFEAKNQETFYPWVTLVFEIKRPQEHYHVPLLLNPFGYSTYRGS